MSEQKISDERLAELLGSNPLKPTWFFSLDEVKSIARELQQARSELGELRNQIALSYAALGDVNQSVYLFDHIHKLRQSHAACVKALEGLMKRRNILDEDESAAYSFTFKATALWNAAGFALAEANRLEPAPQKD